MPAVFVFCRINSKNPPAKGSPGGFLPRTKKRKEKKTGVVVEKESLPLLLRESNRRKIK